MVSALGSMGGVWTISSRASATQGIPGPWPLPLLPPQADNHPLPLLTFCTRCLSSCPAAVPRLPRELALPPLHRPSLTSYTSSAHVCWASSCHPLPPLPLPLRSASPPRSRHSSDSTPCCPRSSSRSLASPSVQYRYKGSPRMRARSVSRSQSVQELESKLEMLEGAGGGEEGERDRTAARRMGWQGRQEWGGRAGRSGVAGQACCCVQHCS